MSRFIAVTFAILAICLILVSAAPAPPQLLDAQTAIQKIIGKILNSLRGHPHHLMTFFSISLPDAYNRIPGPSVVHPWEVARVIDPNTFVAHF
ncbi:hypothetical protein KR067_009312 [Drosophila pandora]|nr:hypothetical protein KR067_009312 [Drosophila pandora]